MRHFRLQEGRGFNASQATYPVTPMTTTRSRKTVRQTARKPIIIQAVVDASAPAGVKSGKERLWWLVVDLIAWRAGDGTVERTPLRLTRQVTDRQLAAFRKKISENSIIRFRGRFGRQPWKALRSVELVSLLPTVPDPDLERTLHEAIQPVRVRDPDFGTLTLNRRVDWFDGQMKWCGNSVEISFCTGDEAELANLLETARRLKKRMSYWKRTVESFAVRKLLPLKNGSWLEEGESKATKQSFLRAMRLTSISILPNGQFEFWHNDGDLFWGHSIQISGDLKRGPSSADIPG